MVVDGALGETMGELAPEVVGAWGNMVILLRGRPRLLDICNASPDSPDKSIGSVFISNSILSGSETGIWMKALDDGFVVGDTGDREEGKGKFFSAIGVARPH